MNCTIYKICSPSGAFYRGCGHVRGNILARGLRINQTIREVMNDKFILDETGNVKPESDLLRWGKWMQRGNRVVKKETIGDVEVSTVFLGMNHNYNKEGPPIIWETMVFGGSHDQEQDRCSGTREQAEALHKKMCERVKGT